MEKPFQWSETKNQKIIRERGVGFEDVITALEDGGYVKTIDNPNYPHQKKIIINIDEYAYLVPFVEDDEKIFFKTIIPCRKATKQYLR